MPDSERIDSPEAMREYIVEALDEFAQGLEGQEANQDVHSDILSFIDGGVLTGDEGFTVKFSDGREFQASIVQSQGVQDFGERKGGGQ